MGKVDPDAREKELQKMHEDGQQQWEKRKQALIEQGKIKPMQKSEAVQRELGRRKQASIDKK